MFPYMYASSLENLMINFTGHLMVKSTVEAYNCVSERWSFKQVIEMNEDIWDATVVSRCYDKILRGCAGIHDFLSFTYL